jgi:hypothetical protein
MPRAGRNQRRPKRTSLDKTHRLLQVDGANCEWYGYPKRTVQLGNLYRSPSPSTRSIRANPNEKPRTAPEILDSIPKAKKLHYIERASVYGVNRSSKEGTVQEPPRTQAGQVRRVSNENDIQSYLLQVYPLESHNECNSHLVVAPTFTQPGRGH